MSDYLRKDIAGVTKAAQGSCSSACKVSNEADLLCQRDVAFRDSKNENKFEASKEVHLCEALTVV